MLNTFCPGRGSNQDLLRGSQTLYRVAIKAGLYRKAVQVCIIPNITTILNGFYICKDSALMGRSTPTTAFDGAI